MRLAVIVASIAAIVDIGYRAYKMSYTGGSSDTIVKTVLQNTVLIVSLAVIGMIPLLTSLSNVFLYTFAIVILLNSGFSVFKGVSSL